MEQNRTLLIVDNESESLRGYTDFLTPAPAPAPRKSSRRSSASGSAAKTTAAHPISEEYRLLLATTGEKAVELVRAEMIAGRRVAAGFFDLRLEGGMDGVATIQAIRALDADIHCVVVTAYHDRSVEEIHQIFGEEFKDQWDYLNKPFSQGEIVQKARQMVAAWNRKRQIESMTSQMIRAERLAGIGQVARGIGHEFGNILLRIVGKTDLALMETDIVKTREHLEVVMSAAQRASVIVRNLASFSKSEPVYVDVPVTKPLDEAISLINHEFNRLGVKLEREYAAVPPVRIESVGIGQVFLNLLINAAHSMPRGGSIRVKVEEAPGPDGASGVATRVADTGCGIPSHVLPHIFEFGYSTKGDRGSGLGLSVSLEIVAAHGGTMVVKTDVGKGTEFTVWLPRGGG